MCIDIKQLDVQGTRLRFYIYYNVVSPLKMANSFGMSVHITISTNSRPITGLEFGQFEGKASWP